MQVDAACLLNDDAGKEVAQCAAGHGDLRGGGRGQLHVQALEVEGFPVQQFFGPGGCGGGGVGAEVFQRHIARQLHAGACRAGLQGHAAQVARIGPQQGQVELVGPVGGQGVGGQAAGIELAAHLGRLAVSTQGHGAAPAQAAGFGAACAQAQRGGEAGGLDAA